MAKGKRVSSLDAALKAVEAGDLATALRSVCQAWHEHPEPALGDLVVAIAARLPPRRVEPAEWVAVAQRRDPVSFDGLMATLGVGQLGAIQERLEALVGQPTDPRLAIRLLQLLTDLPFTSDGSQKMWRRLFKLVAESDDRRYLLVEATLPRQWEVRPAMRAWLEEKWAASLATLRQRHPQPPPELGDEARAAVAAITLHLARPVPPESSVNSADLLAAIYARPDDDTARLIYADHLLDRGDPRGELISLQCRGTLGNDGKRRVKQLLDEHQREWLGAIEPVVGKSGVTFRRGFVFALTTRFRTTKETDRYGGLPEWSTVEELTCGLDAMTAEQTVASQFVSRAMTSLRRIDNFLGAGVGLLCEPGSPWPIESLECRLRDDAQVEVVERFRDTPNLPSLRRLILGTERDPLWLRKAPWASGLEELGLDLRQPSLVEWMSWAAAHPTLRRVQHTSYAVRATFERDPEGRFSRLHVTVRQYREYQESAYAPIRDLVESLPRDALTSLTVELAKKVTVTEPETRAFEELVRQRPLIELVLPAGPERS